MRQQMTTPTSDPAFLVAPDKAPNIEPRQQANPAPAQQPLPSSTFSRQSSHTAAAAPSMTSWDAEYVDLDHYEAVSPAPKKAARLTGSEPPQQPLQQPLRPTGNHTGNQLAAGMPPGHQHHHKRATSSPGSQQRSLGAPSCPLCPQL